MGVFCWDILELPKHQALGLSPVRAIGLGMGSSSSQMTRPEMGSLKASVTCCFGSRDTLSRKNFLKLDTIFEGVPDNYSLPFGNCPRSSSVFLEIHTLLSIPHPFHCLTHVPCTVSVPITRKADSRVGNASSSYTGS